jgi:outer membrane protein OmpA-like peptidoglycan-associated protein
MKKLFSVITVVAIVVTLGLLSGCGGFATKKDIDSLRADIKSGRDEVKGQMAAFDGRLKATEEKAAAATAKAADAQKIAEAKVEQATKEIMNPTAPEPAPADVKVYAAQADVDGLKKTVKNLQERIGSLKTRVTEVSRTQGAVLELTGNSSGKYFFIHFAKGSSEIKGRTAQDVKALKARMKKEKLLAADFVGFADKEPFKGVKDPFKGVKDPAENDAKNKELAEKRANAVKDDLEEDPDTEIVVKDKAEVYYRGSTDQFGPDNNSNRVVMVLLEKNIP